MLNFGQKICHLLRLLTGADLIITARGSSSLIYGSKRKVLAAEKCHYTEFNVCKSVDNKVDYENLKEIDQLINSEFDFSDQDLAKMFFEYHIPRIN